MMGDLTESLGAHTNVSGADKKLLEEFKEHALGHGVAHGKKGNYKFGEEGQHFMGKKAVEALASATKHKAGKGYEKQSQSEALQGLLSKTGLWEGNTLSDKLKEDIKSGGDLSHWAHVFEWLTDGGDFSKVGMKAGKGSTKDLRLSEDQPFDLAWALLKGL